MIVDGSAKDAFMGVVQTGKQETGWQQEILVNKYPLFTFKINTVVAVTAIPATMYSAKGLGKLNKSKKIILGPNSTPLDVVGMFQACLKKN